MDRKIIQGNYIGKGIQILIIISGLIFAIAFATNEYGGKEQEINHFTGFFPIPGSSLPEDNDIRQLIAEKTNAECEEIWLASGETAEEAIASYIASGSFPDFITGENRLYQANALVPIDEYWDDFQNIKNYLSPEKWDALRRSDGHIYWIPQFGVVHNTNAEVTHDGEAFWIQTRVLKWAGYPKIKTLDDYFNVIEGYLEAHPDEDNIGFTVLSDDWRYFCLENPPQFLAGYPNDGSCCVNPETTQVIDYNTMPEAKQYFKKLNEEYKKGIVDPEFCTQKYEEYLGKLCTGKVLGLVDQHWEFAYQTQDALSRCEIPGCNYVPLPITLDEETKNMWHIRRGTEISLAAGLSVTVSCKDKLGAFQFINDLLDEDIMKLRFWGREEIDYHVDQSGKFYRDLAQRERENDPEYENAHRCAYSYFPRVEGLLSDGINAFSGEYQEDEYYYSLPIDVKECLAAYKCKNFVEMLGTNESPGKWYPIYNYSDQLTLDSVAGRTFQKMNAVKMKYLPRVITAKNFELEWDKYMEEYAKTQPDLFLMAMQKEVDRRCE